MYVYVMCFFFMYVAYSLKGFEAPSPPKKQKKSSAEIIELVNAKSSHDWVNQEVSEMDVTQSLCIGSPLYLCVYC